MTLHEGRLQKSAGAPGTCEDLGAPIRNATTHAGGFIKTEDGKDRLCLVLDGATGEDARIVEVDLDRERVVRVVRLPGAMGAFTAGVSSDGSVYVASYNQGGVYRYTPWDGEVESLGKPTPETSFNYSLTAGPDGSMYAGTYPDCVFYKIKPSEGFERIGPKPFEAGESYVRSLSHTECGRYSYVGIGSHARLKRYDHKTGDIREVLPEPYWEDEFVYTSNLVNNKLIVRLHPSNRMLVFDVDQLPDGEVEEHLVLAAANIGSMGVSPEHEGMVYYTSAGVLHSYDLKGGTVQSIGVSTGIGPVVLGFVKLKDQTAYPGKTLVGAGSRLGKTRIFKYNPASGTYSEFDLDVEGTPTDLQCVVTGSDGKLYMGAFLVGGTSVFDPETDTFTEYKGVGQIENIAELGGKMYFGVYPLAKLFEYDPSRPWDLADGGTNPKLLFDHAELEQDRPYGMAVGEGKLFIGTICGYGKLGGAVLTYDPATRERQAHRNPLHNLSIISLLYRDGRLYGGTTVYGGLGITPDPEEEAKLLVYHVTFREAKGVPLPVRGLRAITALAFDAKGLLWGMAEGYLFAYDPADESFELCERLFPDINFSKKAVWRDAALLIGKDGTLYGTIEGSKLFRYEPGTRKMSLLIEDGAKFLAQDHQGRLYFSDSKTRLRRYTF